MSQPQDPNRPTVFKRAMTVDDLNRNHIGTMCEHIGIEITEIGPDYLRGRMPADRRTVQPMGIVHGGASVALAETLGSVSAFMCTEPGMAAVGLDINANHIRSVREGWVYGHCTPVHIGRTTQVWQIDIRDEAGRMTCASRITMAVIPDPRKG